MLDRCDRVQIAVHDAAKAAQRFGQLLGSAVARRDHSRHLGAKRTILAVGESEFELCEADGAGLTQDFLARRGEGLMTAGYCTADLDSMVKRWEGLGVAYDRDAEQLYLAPETTFGLPIVISESTYRPRVGPVSFLYETTNTLASDWRRVAAVYAGLFGLDPARFSEIGSERFGYVGTLTLFDPPNRLDRIELSQVTDDVHAMGRFVKKHGDLLYMCYVEVHDWPAVRGRAARGRCALHAARCGSGDRSRRWLGASQGAARAAARRLAHGACLGLVGSRGAGAIGMKRRSFVLVHGRRAARGSRAARRPARGLADHRRARPALPAGDAGARHRDQGRREGEGPHLGAHRLGIQARRRDVRLRLCRLPARLVLGARFQADGARPRPRRGRRRRSRARRSSTCSTSRSPCRAGTAMRWTSRTPQGALVQMRTYIVKDRLFRLLVTAKNNEASKAAAKRFLDLAAAGRDRGLRHATAGLRPLSAAEDMSGPEARAPGCQPSRSPLTVPSIQSVWS